jgi:hypothetical protein
VQLAIALPELLKVMSVMAEPIIATWSNNASFSLTVNAQDPIISKLNRFTEVNVSSAYNDNDGYQNVSNHSAGATVQLAIALPELLKVMSVMAEPIIATWSAPAAFARLGGIVLPSEYQDLFN